VANQMKIIEKHLKQKKRKKRKERITQVQGGGRTGEGRRFPRAGIKEVSQKTPLITKHKPQFYVVTGREKKGGTRMFVKDVGGERM